MEPDDLTRMTRIEGVIDGELAPQEKDVFNAAAARGLTSLPGVSGLGRSRPECFR